MMQNKEKYLMPFFLFILSLILRLALISKGPYHVDCLDTTVSALKTLSTGQLHFVFGPGYPLSILLAAAFIYVAKLFSFSDPVVAVNLMSVVFSSLCIFVNYLLVRKLFDESSAFFSSIMFSLFPIFLGISVYGKNHTPSLFFLLLGLLLFLHFQTTQKKWHLILSALSWGFMGACRLQDLILMIIPIIFFFYFPTGPWTSENTSLKSLRSKTASLLLFIFIIAIVVLIFHVPFFLQSDSTVYLNQLFNFWNLGLTSNFRGLFSISFGLSLTMIIFALTPVGAFVSLLGFLKLFKFNKRLFLFLLLWFFIPLLFYGNLNTTTSRFLVISVIPIFMVQGYFFSYLLSFQNRFFERAVLFSFCWMTLLLFSQIFPILHFRHQHALLPDWARWISKTTEPNAIIITSDEGPFIEYYGERKILYRPTALFIYDEEHMQSFKKTVDQFLKENIPVYITSSGLHSYDFQKIFINWMIQNYELIYRTEHFSEDWHAGETVLRVGIEKLYQIHKKSRLLKRYLTRHPRIDSFGAPKPRHLWRGQKAPSQSQP